MKLPPRTSWALFFLLPALSSCSNTVSGPEEKGYILPDLAGWQKDAQTKQKKKSVSVAFRKVVDGTKLQLRLAVSLPGNDNSQDAASLRAHREAELVFEKRADPTFRVLQQKETTFRGLPAYLTRTSDKHHGADRERQTLYVADSQHAFSIKQTLTGNPIASLAHTEAGTAWHKFTIELQIPTS